MENFSIYTNKKLMALVQKNEADIVTMLRSRAILPQKTNLSSVAELYFSVQVSSLNITSHVIFLA